MTDIKKYLSRRIAHAEKRVKQFKDSHGDKPAQTHTYFGGWELGYWEGLLAAYHNVLDEIEEMEKDND